MSNIEIGDYAKVEDENRVFKVCGFSKNHKYIPDGWLIEQDGSYVNPKFCSKYDGAISVPSLRGLG
jgi:hypothetical protein